MVKNYTTTSTIAITVHTLSLTKIHGFSRTFQDTCEKFPRSFLEPGNV